ncbi:MAG: protein kinase [Chitinophagales bacterium]|nr:protein kinase [Chitinophagales bacterium]MCZ2393512.1 protein kinase [Chitinophagales bacterium]
MKNKILNGFTLKYLLGRGGMAEVWYAENNLGKPAAIKIMLPQFIGMEQVVSRFEIEAKAMVKLNHLNIRDVFDFGEYEGRPFIIMEYLDGKDFGQYLAEGKKFSDADLQKWWKQALSALAHTHEQKIIHRDIKPSNLFLQKNGNIKILDFGIAKVKDEISLTNTGQGLGTVLYMSPEQILDPRRVTSATDIYSLGMTFASLLKGKSVLDITEDDVTFAIQQKIIESQFNLNNISKEWLNYIKPTLMREASDRPSAQNFFSSIGQISSGEPIEDLDKTEVLGTKITSKNEPSEIDPLPPKMEVPKNATDIKKILKIIGGSIVGIILLFMILPEGVEEDVVATEVVEATEEETHVTGKEFTIGSETYNYTGAVENGLPNGKGKATFISSLKKHNSYEGEFKNGLRNGTGVLVNNNGDEAGTYEGTFQDNQKIKGKYTWKDGDYFIGTFKNDEINTGSFFNEVGSILAEYKNGKQIK